jgi:hypothetical protein
MPEVSYGHLDEVLRGLGFSARIAKGDALEGDARVYRHPGTEALIVLPVFPAEETVLPHHLLAVRATLDNFGIADPLDFNAMLQKAS